LMGKILIAGYNLLIELNCYKLQLGAI
jgi:hypothetical protein